MAEWTEIFELSEQLGEVLIRRNATVTSAESCTGGGVAFALTSSQGASSWFHQSITTYSNEAKVQLAGVSKSLLSSYGAVSEQVAAEMAIGAALKANADYAVSISGIAGPTGGSEGKPVGTVCFGWCIEGRVDTTTELFSGDRHSVRMQSIKFALNGLLQRI